MQSITVTEPPRRGRLPVSRWATAKHGGAVFALVAGMPGESASELIERVARGLGWTSYATHVQELTPCSAA